MVSWNKLHPKEVIVFVLIRDIFVHYVFKDNYYKYNMYNI